MSIRIIKQRETKTVTEYNREYRFRDDPSAGFSFPCDKDGKLVDGLAAAALENYERCKTDDRLEDLGVVARNFTYTEPAIGKCDCGCENRMEDQTNGYAAFQCDGCDQWYNLAGQEIKPPERWNDFGEMDDDERY